MSDERFSGEHFHNDQEKEESVNESFKSNEKNEEFLKESFENMKENEETVIKDFWKKIKKFTGKIPFTKEAVAMYYCSLDSKTPLWAKGIALGALAYFISPADAIPDAIVALGFVDDAAIITAALKAISDNVTDEHHKKAEDFFTSEK
ncbi:MAG: YkvA family protein [Bacillota bacterium]